MDRTAANDNVFAFNVTYFPSGQRNLHIVTQILAPSHLSHRQISSRPPLVVTRHHHAIHDSTARLPGSLRQPGQETRSIWPARATSHWNTASSSQPISIGSRGQSCQAYSGDIRDAPAAPRPAIASALVWCGARRALESSIWYVPLIQTFNLSFFVPSLLVRPQG